jgi:hypothetical protein
MDLISLFISQASQPATLPADPAGALNFVKGAYTSKEWTLLVGAVLMIVVRIATLIKPLASRLPAESAKWIAMGLGVASSLGTNLLAGAGWVYAIVNGVTAGFLAIGTWETMKQLPGMKKKEEEE